MLWCSQVAPGNENSLKIRVYGSKGGLEWNQESPNRMLFTEYGMPTSALTRAGAGFIAETDTLTRTPSGHPEGYLEAFANIYLQTADVIRAHIPGSRLPDDPPLPGISDGLLGVSFVDACVRSSRRNSSWVPIH